MKSPTNRNDVVFIAHRGESYDAPENTLAAINLAWQRGADAVEIDVHLSKDGKIVVIHDDNIMKIAGKYIKIKDLTLVELRSLDAGSHKDIRWANERIPVLEEALATVPAGKPLFIEIKCGSEILNELRNVILKSKLDSQQIKLIGFRLETLKHAKKVLPECEAFWVNNTDSLKKNGTWQPIVSELIRKAKQVGLDGLDLSACEAIEQPFVEMIKTAGMLLYVWTVNDPSAARRLIEAGVAGITTDRAYWLKQQLGF